MEEGVSNGSIVYKYTYVVHYIHYSIIRKKREAGKARFHLEVKSFKLSAYQDFPFDKAIWHMRLISFMGVQ